MVNSRCWTNVEAWRIYCRCSCTSSRFLPNSKWSGPRVPASRLIPASTITLIYHTYHRIWFRSRCKYQVSHGICKRCVCCQMSLSNQNLNGTQFPTDRSLRPKTPLWRTPVAQQVSQWSSISLLNQSSSVWQRKSRGTERLTFTRSSIFGYIYTYTYIWGVTRLMQDSNRGHLQWGHVPSRVLILCMWTICVTHFVLSNILKQRLCVIVDVQVEWWGQETTSQ